MTRFALAAAALVPLVAGTSAHGASDGAVTVALCNGGEITIDLGKDEDPSQRDCHNKGCHAGACREKHKTKPNRPT